MQFHSPKVNPFVNEPVRGYLPGSPERNELERELTRMKSECVEIPVIIDGREIRTGNTSSCVMPHDHQHVLGVYHKAGREEAALAIESSLKAKKKWESLPWSSRVAIFLKAAELAAGPWRAKLNAATMLSQSKTFKQAEIDAACELVDFMRFNAYCLSKLYADQPISGLSAWNKTDYRPLEGFVFAVAPFNFTAIGSNLAAAPAICGNTVLLKPASAAVYSAYVVYKLYEAAGLPAGVINFLPGDASEISDVILGHDLMSGVHFTGSTKTFQNIWKTVGNQLENYRTFPRLVGETGGKNFVIAHTSADVKAVAHGLAEGAFEYQGQKCSAASRAYLPKGLWPEIQTALFEEIGKIKTGNVEDLDTFMGAVIDEKSFNNIKQYIETAVASDEAQVIAGGGCSKEKGFFVEPTVILTTNPHFITMEEEIFGPVLTVYLYEDEAFEDTLALCDKTSKYGLTGSVFATDPYAIQLANQALTHSAGNFYINVRPTGAVVGQQPFGGSRLSGTNDKAGSMLNLLRWMSPRSIKENLA